MKTFWATNLYISYFCACKSSCHFYVLKFSSYDRVRGRRTERAKGRTNEKRNAAHKTTARTHGNLLISQGLASSAGNCTDQWEIAVRRFSGCRRRSPGGAAAAFYRIWLDSSHGALSRRNSHPLLPRSCTVSRLCNLWYQYQTAQLNDYWNTLGVGVRRLHTRDGYT